MMRTVFQARETTVFNIRGPSLNPQKKEQCILGCIGGRLFLGSSQRDCDGYQTCSLVGII